MQYLWIGFAYFQKLRNDVSISWTNDSPHPSIAWDSHEIFFFIFFQPQVLRSSTSDDLINIDLESNKVPAKSIFLGKARTFINNKRKVDRDFQEKLLRNYLDTSEYIQQKLPLKNQNMKAFSCIDPKKILNGDEDYSRFNLSGWHHAYHFNWWRMKRLRQRSLFPARWSSSSKHLKKRWRRQQYRS